MPGWVLSDDPGCLRYEQLDGPYAVEPRGNDWIVIRTCDPTHRLVSGPFTSSDAARKEADRLQQTESG